jgi:hypothetical protein
MYDHDAHDTHSACPASAPARPTPASYTGTPATLTPGCLDELFVEQVLRTVRRSPDNARGGVAYREVVARLPEDVPLPAGETRETAVLRALAYLESAGRVLSTLRGFRAVPAELYDAVLELLDARGRFTVHEVVVLLRAVAHHEG